jgi:hypothetical protein
MRSGPTSGGAFKLLLSMQADISAGRNRKICSIIVRSNLNLWIGRALQAESLNGHRSAQIYPAFGVEQFSTPGHHGYPRAAGFLTGQASARASQITKLQLRRVILVHSYHFRLANLGGKLSAITLQLQQQMLVRSSRRGEVLPRRS